MDKQTWTIAGVIVAVLLIGIAGLTFSAKNRELARQRAEMEEAAKFVTRAKNDVAAREAEVAELKERLAQAEARISELQQERDWTVQSRNSLENEMRTALESKDVTISQLQGKLTVNILDRVLFDSGEAQVKLDGESVLRKVAGFLTKHPNLKVHVIGHTDNVPIKATARSRFPSNWELSSARANAAVRFLSEQGGVDPRRLGAVGYGEFRPIADNSTPEGRARNRRIAITVLSEELAGVDVPTARTNAPVSRLGPATQSAAPVATETSPKD
jgi:chemotaxis protein MotB